MLGLALAAPAGAAKPAPVALDCAVMPCADVMPSAAGFRPVEGALYWEALDEAGDVVGWLALTTLPLEPLPSPAESGISASFPSPFVPPSFGPASQLVFFWVFSLTPSTKAK